MPRPLMIVAKSIVISWGLIAVGAAAGQPASAETPKSSADQALASIDSALDLAKSEDLAERLAGLQKAVDAISAQAPQNVLLAEVLSSAKEAARAFEKQGELAKSATALQKGLRDARDILQFKLVDEGPQPDEFPALTPVGELRVKQYPAYRLARAKSRKDSAFWTLFKHIQKNGIAMTSPVEMTYQANGEAQTEQSDMAFLYRTTKQGKLGADGDVAVVDVPAMTVVSIGMRGSQGDEQIAKARKHLDRWLAEHSREYLPSGPLRVMGYNSPMTATKKRYFAVEIPIAPTPPPQ